MEEFIKELSNLGLDPYRVVARKDESSDESSDRCGGFRCGGFRCGGFRCGNPIENLDTEQVALLLLASIGFEELGLAHLINVEAEKLQGAIGTLEDKNGNLVNPLIKAGSLAELLQANREVEKVLRTIIKKEMLLEFKFENILEFLSTTTSTTTTSTTTTSTTTTSTSTTTSTTSTSTTTTTARHDCTVLLTGTLGGQNISATATADINADGSCITFTLTNTSPLNPDNSSTLIDQFFFELAGPFIPNITGSSDVGWSFVDNNGNNVTPVDCGLFRYKFESGASTTRLATGESGTFTICSTAGTFSTARLTGQPVCARVQNIGGTSGASGCACGTWNCP